MPMKRIIGRIVIAIILISITHLTTNAIKGARVASPSPLPAPTPQIQVVEKVSYIQEPSKIDAVNLGTFEITYYTAGKESTGKSKGDPEFGITRSGAHVTKGVTIAVDPDIIELGSYIYIEGIGFRVAQDTGSAIKGKAIDVYVPGVKEALAKGRHQAQVYIIRRGEAK